MKVLYIDGWVGMNEGVNLSIYSFWEIDERRVGDERYKCHYHHKYEMSISTLNVFMMVMNVE